MTVRLTMIALVLLVGGCQDRSAAAAQASVTVKLPLPRPYSPKPAFSFGSAPRAS